MATLTIKDGAENATLPWMLFSLDVSMNKWQRTREAAAPCISKRDKVLRRAHDPAIARAKDEQIFREQQPSSIDA